MSNSNFRLQQLRIKIKNGEIKSTLSDLERLGRDSTVHTEILILSSRNIKNEQSKELGILSDENYSLEYNRITNSLLSLINKIQLDESLLNILNYDGIEYIMGFDLGDAESALAFVEINSSNKTKPFICKLDGEEESVTTALLTPREEDFLIGKQAVLTCEDSRDLLVNFKKSPNNEKWKKHRRSISDFSEALFTQLYSKNKNINRFNTVLYVGHPSSWTSQEITAYKDVFASLHKTLPLQIEVVSESRSALICARDYSDIPTETLQQNVLVIDIGSSTTDFSFLENGVPKEFPLGKEFGCQLIDFSIKGWLLKIHPSYSQWIIQLSGKTGRSFQQDNYLTLLCRMAKEVAFGSNRILERPLEPSFSEVYDAFEPILRKLDEVTIRQLLLTSDNNIYLGSTWEQAFQSLLKDAKNMCGESISAILVTGGGSKMHFVKELCSSVFGISENNIYAGIDPAYAVAIGLAGYGKWKFKLERYHRDVQELCDTELNVQIRANVNELNEGILYTMLPIGYDKFAKPLIRKFITGEIEMDVLGDSLLNFAGKEVAEWLNNDPEGQIYYDKISKNFLAALTSWFSKETDVICRNYGITPGTLNVNFSIPSNLFENAFTDFVSNLGTSLAKGTIGRIPVSMRKKLFAWLINEKAEKVISFLYSTSVNTGLAGAKIVDWLIQKALRSKNSDTDSSFYLTPFALTSANSLQVAFSEAIHKKAEEAELFIQ